MPFLTLHAHFYQPPRENPWTDEIDREPTAEPYHDWNERIAEECYRPNAFARVIGGDGRVVGILNNYAYLSFNVGPTLLSWIRAHAPDVYERIKQGDAASLKRLGHGNAIAQVYNHLIMPLANPRDQVTQVRWGLADFRFHFGREAEAMWLAETAVDYDTLEILAAHGMRYVILAPSQAARIRPLGAIDHTGWAKVSDGNIDPSRAYLCRLSSGRSLAVFFYDGPLSHAAGYGDLFRDSQRFVSTLAGAVDPNRLHPQLIHLATDGETFGHHKKFAELTLIYALTHEAPAHDFTVTNYAAYLDAAPPQWEVEIKPATAWSCAHGLGRWSRDCGCRAGGPADWHQRWRAPLRLALDRLRDELAKIYEREAPALLGDPWAARDAYGAALPDRTPERLDAFLTKRVRPHLAEDERERALTLLEMQRHALLMYTSCGWFFNDIAGLETAQVLKYAARAIDLASRFDGAELTHKLLDDLETAESNEKQYGNGAEVYRRLVQPAAIGPERVAASYAINALVDPFPVRYRRHAYRIEQVLSHARQVGDYRLVCGHLRLTSDSTSRTSQWTYAALHLGGYNFAASATRSHSADESERFCAQLFKRLHRMTPPKLARLLKSVAGANIFSLGDLPPSDRRRLMKTLEQETLSGLANSYEQIYTQHMGTIQVLRAANMPVPVELRVAAEYTLSHRLAQAALELARDPRETTEQNMRHVLELAERDGLRLERGWTTHNLEQAVVERVRLLINTPSGAPDLEAFRQVIRLIEIAERLGFSLRPARVQEMMLDYLCQSANDLPPELARKMAEVLYISPAAIPTPTRQP